MTDAFPAAPVPGSNAIGFAQIGVISIGTIPPFVWQKTVLPQYANSPRLIALIQNFASYIDQTANFDAFFDLIWNVDTAQGVGLDIWGRIVGVSRTLSVIDVEYLGFEEASAGGQAFPFGQAPFYSGQTLTSNYNLTDSSFRLLILAKALFNICDGSIPAINQLLLTLFPGRGNCYVTEGIGAAARYLGFEESGVINSDPFGQSPFYAGQPYMPMTMTYTFNFKLTPAEFAIVTQSGVLPTPCGVSASIIVNA